MKVVLEVVSSSYKVSNKLRNTSVKNVIGVLADHFFSPYRSTYYDDDAEFFLNWSNTHKEWLLSNKVHNRNSGIIAS